MVQCFAAFKGIAATRVSFFMLCGPLERPIKYGSAFVKFSEAALAGEPLMVHINAECSWVRIGDAVNALCLLMERKQDEPYGIFYDWP